MRDASPDAYEKVVDRLLASPRYGERMAFRWLEAARYADTNGYQTDAARDMWRWRDWVIGAFNRNLSYDRFTIEQIAGDLLPGATRDQVIATGFNRNHRNNGEGGIIPEEYAAEYVFDRVDTTSTVWLGVTLGCARCHNHKFDPFTQKEFYQLFAYFDQVPERGNAFKYGNSPPSVAAPLPEQEERLKSLERRLATADQKFEAMQPRIRQVQARWEQSVAATTAADSAPSRAVAVNLPLSGDLSGEITADPPRSEKYLYLMENGPVLGAIPFTGKAQWKDGEPSFSAGPTGQAGAFDGKGHVDLGNVGNFGFYDSFTLSAWINPATSSGTIVSRALDEPEGKGFALVLKDGHLSASLVQRWLDDGVRLDSDAVVPMNRWSHVCLTYDGSRLASGVRLYLDGRPLNTKVELDYMNQPFDVKQPLRIAAGLGPGNRFRGRIGGVRIYRTALDGDDVAVLALPDAVSSIAAAPKSERSAAQSRKLRLVFLERHAPDEIRTAWQNLADLRDARERLIESFPTVMVMQDSKPRRETHVLLRGACDRPGEKVEPGVPAALPPLPAGALTTGWASRNGWSTEAIRSRLGLRSIGSGRCISGRAGEDRGGLRLAGRVALHPELLDWLATEFMDTGWDMKAMQKAIVMSATYRQSSMMTPDCCARIRRIACWRGDRAFGSRRR